jgi:hypothetical protein
VLGFDIRAHRIVDASTGEVHVRRIEVKGRMRGQAVRLSVRTEGWFGNPYQHSTVRWS